MIASLSLDGLRCLVDRLCADSNELTTSIEFWNSYLRGLVQIVRDADAKQEIVDHAFALVEENMPHYRVVPNEATITAVLTLAASGTRNEERARLFLSKMIKAGVVTKEKAITMMKN